MDEIEFDETPQEPQSVADRLAAEALIVDVDGFEGPLDLLLMLSRTQKVDLRKISVLELARQYLAFVEKAKALRIELAADYLVMAAWLAYLKSRLLLPKNEAEDDYSPEQMAEALRFQLQRLEAMRKVGAELLKLPQLGTDRHARGMEEKVSNQFFSVYDLTLFELLKTYGDIKQRSTESALHIVSTKLFAVDEALERLRLMLGKIPNWQSMIDCLPKGLHNAVLARSAVASTFVASLELVKEGLIDLRQDKHFGPIFLRGRK